jgi:XTP/dITP diphosphohydrolase
MTNAKLLLATNNRGKLEELRLLLAGLPFDLTSPADLGLELEVDENGGSYTANARLKASAFARASGLLTLADDSGLEVAALAGVPGVHSSRYAGPNASDRQRIDFLLSKLKAVPMKNRKAHFRCVIVIASPRGGLRMCSGSCAGVITLAPRGDRGFGYDPIFYFPNLGKTMAELPTETKNRISHRAKAAARAKKILTGLLENNLSLET